MVAFLAPSEFRRISGQRRLAGIAKTDSARRASEKITLRLRDFRLSHAPLSCDGVLLSLVLAMWATFAAPLLSDGELGGRVGRRNLGKIQHRLGALWLNYA